MSTAQLEDTITTPSVVTGDGQSLAQQQNKHKENESDHWQPDKIANVCKQQQQESDKQNETNAIERSKIEKSVAVHRRNSNNQKLHFRQPQQGSLSKKIRPFKARIFYQQCIKADMENSQNLKNQAVHRKQHQPKNVKQNFNNMNNNRTAQFSIRSKFFLPDKRPRKEIIIPPTKFLLGGNISDPLNLNSLQDEALNATPNQTPRQSPITTPPKVEVIIPPNIYDPLHLLDPVDSIEYEKQLVSPMKRKSKSKHRNRKKKPKRKRMNDSASDSSIIATMATTTTTTTIIPPCTIPVTTTISAAPTAACSISGATSTTTAISSEMLETSASSFTGDTSRDLSGILLTDDEEKCVDGGAQNDSVEGGSAVGGGVESSAQQKENNNESASKLMLANSSSLAVRRSIDREKVTRDLRLDLNGIGGGEQQMSIGGGRKRRISEGPNSTKNKFRRMDSMDKIVSPVVPQPGAWKRPPRTVPTGARKGSRLRSTSVSETELISPTDDNKTIDSESVRGDTPDIEAQKQLPGGSSTLADIPTDVSTQDQEQQQHQQQYEQQKEQEPIPKFKPDGARFQYGNYDRYSGYRNLNEIMDVRLQVFRRHGHLFRGKDILDIGCNVGHITMAVAKDLTPKSILGLDIDRNLIMRARKNLSFYVKIPNHTTNLKKNTAASSSSDGKSRANVDKSASHEITSTQATSTESTSTTTTTCATTTAAIAATNNESAEPNESDKNNSIDAKVESKRNLNAKRKTHQKPKNEKEKHEFFPISFPITYGGVRELSSYTQNKDDSSPACIPDSDNEFPRNVFFRAANYVLKDESLINNETQQYDVILCLSVTKWIHLNFGDAGLKQAFKRMFNQLRPGGKLILEAQNWASYKKKKNLTETIYNNYRNIDFFPNKFHEYLLGSEVGFSHSYCLGVPRHMNKGFCRPIQLYAKGDYTPNHIQWSDNYHPQTPYEAYRGIYAGITRPPYPLWGGYDTPHGNSGSYSCRQTPHHGISTSQYYNPLETDSYLPSYDTQITNRHYVFASPLYQTVWSPPASLRNASNKTPKFGSIREMDADDGCPVSRHVYPPNGSSPQASGSGSAFNSFREPDLDDYSQHAQTSKPHVYANCDNSSSPKIHNSLSPKIDNSSSPKVDNSSSPKVNSSSLSPKVENSSSSPSNSSTPRRNQSDSVDDTEIESMMNAGIEGN